MAQSSQIAQETSGVYNEQLSYDVDDDDDDDKGECMVGRIRIKWNLSRDRVKE